MRKELKIESREQVDVGGNVLQQVENELVIKIDAIERDKHSSVVTKLAIVVDLIVNYPKVYVMDVD